MDALSYAFLLGSGDSVKMASEEDQYLAGFVAGVVSFMEHKDEKLAALFTEPEPDTVQALDAVLGKLGGDVR